MLSKSRALARCAAVPISALILGLWPASGQAACVGCSPSGGPSAMVCTSSCLSEGYSLTVIKTIPGGPTLPTGCTGSASGQYLYLEPINTVRNYSQVEFAASGIGPDIHTSIAVKQPGPNELMCNVEGATLSGPVYTVTKVHFGQTICIPARENTIDCGGANTMAHRYNARLPAVPLPVCRDDCHGYSASGSGGSKWIGSLSPGGFTYPGKLEADPNATLKVPAKEVPAKKAPAKPR